MIDAESAALSAVALAKRRGLREVGADELLLGCLRVISRFGIVQLGPWTFDLETLGMDWLDRPEKNGAKVAYSQAVVDILDLAARIARSEESTIHVEHVLAAFADQDGGLMRDLKKTHGITSSSWRTAIASRKQDAGEEREQQPSSRRVVRDYLTPEDAAEELGVHVQTLRAYVRSGKLPAHRLAGERAIRIRRIDLEKILEPLQPD